MARFVECQMQRRIDVEKSLLKDARNGHRDHVCLSYAFLKFSNAIRAALGNATNNFS